MKPQTFIEKAIAGGYGFHGLYKNYGLGNPKIEFGTPTPPNTFQINIWTIQDGIMPHRVKDEIQLEQVLLDPLFWQAIGRVEGWDAPAPEGFVRFQDIDGEPYWRYKMHCFIDFLCNGLTLEEAFTKSTI